MGKRPIPQFTFRPAVRSGDLLRTRLKAGSITSEEVVWVCESTIACFERLPCIRNLIRKEELAWLRAFCKCLLRKEKKPLWPRPRWLECRLVGGSNAVPAVARMPCCVARMPWLCGSDAVPGCG